MEDLVSVIVPVCNSEKYLSRCVDSILAQTYKNLEIILVDDGSTDNGYALLKEYEAADNRVIALTKENGGISDARNFGLRKATGKFIAFIDSDDCVDSRMIELSVNARNSLGADIVGFDWQTFSTQIPPVAYKKKKTVKTGKSVLSYFLENNRLYCVVRYLFSNEIIKNNGLLFDRAIRSGGEDQLFIYEYVKRCNNAVFIKYDGYFYYENEQSTSSGTVKSNHYNDINVRKFIYEDCDKKYRKRAKAHLLKGYIAFCAKAIKFGSTCEEDIVKTYRKIIKMNILSIIFSPYYGFKHKMAALCISLSVALTKKFLQGVRI